MNRGGLRADGGEALRVGIGDQAGIDAAQTVSDLSRTRESNLHRNLLIEQHPDEQSERFFGQQRIGRRILSQLPSRHGTSLGGAPKS